MRALILAPTRELAIQVEEQIKEYGKYTNLRSTCVFGGVDIRQQLPIVRAGVEILVATPGRLLDHVEQKSVNLGQVEILVLDEADRMLDMGFIPDIKRIMALLPDEAAEPALLGDVLQRDQEARRRAAQRAAADRSRAAQYRGRNGFAKRVQAAAGREARRCSCTS